ncbi:uncharacterized protein L199_000677 [Kwoniella botswanensis]|uniref:uncharacterized protein n=1 Tax=Kwoniella botswanensis TaxID=1268659 RepID=UPI00315D6AC7
METSSQVLDIFLNIVSVSEPTLQAISFQTASRLLKLLEKFECSVKMVNPVRERIDKAGSDDSWDLLVHASRRDDLN